MELTASKTAACTIASAREALPGLFCRGAASRLSFLSASRAMAFHPRTTSAESRQRSSRASRRGAGRAPRVGVVALRERRAGLRELFITQVSSQQASGLWERSLLCANDSMRYDG